jgi:agmatine/peptidylarginine deiminase
MYTSDISAGTTEIFNAKNRYFEDTLVVKYNNSCFLLDTSKIDIFYQSPTDVWFRDPGSIFGITKNNELGVADFKYTNYMNVLPDSVPEWAMEFEGIDRDVARRLNIPSFSTIVAMEGGAFETNGKGDLIQVGNVTFKRNPHLSKKEIEKENASKSLRSPMYIRIHMNILLIQHG